jgi:hypothetical protein
MGSIQSIRKNEDLCVCIKPTNSNDYIYELVTCDNTDSNLPLRNYIEQHNIEKDIVNFNKAYIYLGNKQLIDTHMQNSYTRINNINDMSGFLNKLINGIIIAYKDNLNNNKLKNECN